MTNYCINHPDKKALSFCHSCRRHYCINCLVEGTEFYYCKSEQCHESYIRETAQTDKGIKEIATDQSDNNKVRIFIFGLLALLSIFVSILCFGILFSTCSGQPPSATVSQWSVPLSALGVLIIPITFWGFALFLYLTGFFIKEARHRSSDSLTKQAKQLLKKIVIFVISFGVGAFASFFLFGLHILLAMQLPNWMDYIIFPLFTALAVYSGVVTYKKMERRFVNSGIETDAE